VQALILIKLFPTSLLLVSVYGLLDNIVRLAFGSVIGQFVDRWVATPHCLEAESTCLLAAKLNMLLVAVMRLIQVSTMSSSPAGVGTSPQWQLRRGTVAVLCAANRTST
jgi:hypothetical protein